MSMFGLALLLVARRIASRADECVQMYIAHQGRLYTSASLHFRQPFTVRPSAVWSCTYLKATPRLIIFALHLPAASWADL